MSCKQMHLSECELSCLVILLSCVYLMLLAVRLIYLCCLFLLFHTGRHRNSRARLSWADAVEMFQCQRHHSTCNDVILLLCIVVTFATDPILLNRSLGRMKESDSHLGTVLLISLSCSAQFSSVLIQPPTHSPFHEQRESVSRESSFVEVQDRTHIQ